MATYVYRSSDFGATWQPLAVEGVTGYAWVVKQDPVNPDLLYAGTELGLYISPRRRRALGPLHREPAQVAVHDLWCTPPSTTSSSPPTAAASTSSTTSAACAA
jgi:hypothetical protein